MGETERERLNHTTKIRRIPQEGQNQYPRLAGRVEENTDISTGTRFIETQHDHSQRRDQNRGAHSEVEETDIKYLVEG